MTSHNPRSAWRLWDTSWRMLERAHTFDSRCWGMVDQREQIGMLAELRERYAPAERRGAEAAVGEAEGKQRRYGPAQCQVDRFVTVRPDTVEGPQPRAEC